MHRRRHGRRHVRRARLTDPSGRRPGLALGLTLWVQALTACTLSIYAVLAPAVAPELGLRVEQVGWFVGACYILAMTSGLVTSAYVPRFGALGLSQAALVASAAGLAVTAQGASWAFMVAAILIGWGYGLTNPTSAALLGEHAPPDRRGLFFSIKQTGVPLGIAMAGGIGPLMYQAAGWRSTVVLIAAVCAVTAAAMAPVRQVFDHGRDPAVRVQWLTLLRPLRQVMQRPGLRRLAIVSLVYALIQVNLLTFLVAFLHLEHAMSLAQAAGLLAMAQVTSILARPGWGWLADRRGQPARLLGLLGLGMSLACLLLAALSESASLSWVVLAVMGCAATAIGWNGVYYAELVGQAGPGELATVTGACQFMTFMGPVFGPPAFALIVTLSGSYRPPLVVLAILGGLAGLWILASSRRGPA